MTTKVTASQLRATANLHDRIRAANARFGVKADDDRRHRQAAAKLRRRSERAEPEGT